MEAKERIDLLVMRVNVLQHVLQTLAPPKDKEALEAMVTSFKATLMEPIPGTNPPTAAQLEIAEATLRDLYQGTAPTE